MTENEIPLTKLAKLRLRCFRNIRYRKRRFINKKVPPQIDLKESILSGEEEVRGFIGYQDTTTYSEDDYRFFKHFIFFLKFYLPDFFSVYFMKRKKDDLFNDFFVFFFKRKFKLNYFNFFCLKKVFFEKKQGIECPNFTGDLRSLTILEMCGLDIHFGEFTASFFFSYRIDDLIFLYYRNCYFFNLHDYFYLKEDIDYWIHFFYNAYISGVAYFFPKLRSALCHRYRNYIFFGEREKVTNYKIFINFGLPYLYMENYLMNLYFCKFIFFSFKKENVLFSYYTVDASLVAFTGQDVVSLWTLLSKWDLDNCISVIFDCFMVYFYLSMFFFIQHCPKLLYFSKLSTHHFMNLVAMGMGHDMLNDEVYDKIVFHFKNKWLSIQLSNFYYLNSSFFSMFFVSFERDFGKVVLDRFFYFLPALQYRQLSQRDVMLNAMSISPIDYFSFVHGDVSYLDNLYDSYSNLSVILFDPWKVGYYYYTFTNFVFLFFWRITNFSFLWNFFSYSLTFPLVLSQIYIDDFFLHRFITSLGFFRYNILFLHREKLGDNKEEDSFKYVHFLVFFFLRDNFFKLLKTNDNFLIYFFFSLNEKLLFKFSRYFFRRDFVKLREFILSKNYTRYCKNFFFKKVYCNHKFIK